MKGDAFEQSSQDEFANAYGRRFGSNFNIPCDLACSPFRPPSFVGRGINDQGNYYWNFRVACYLVNC